jgi:hypothetical protein
LGVLGSLVYSTLFPTTVVLGGTRAQATGNSYLNSSLWIAGATVLLSLCNLRIEDLSLWSSVLTLDSRLYFSLLLYFAIFGAISETATTSFNFEENSLISQAVTHLVLYVSQVPMRDLTYYEIFLPAWTFGLMIAISPATPFLKRIRAAKDPIRLVLISFIVVFFSVVLSIRPWILEALGEDPVIWVLKYMLWSDGFQIRLLIVSWWLVVLAFGILVPVWFFSGSDGQDNGESLNKRRKFFHGIVVLLFIPSLCLDVLLSTADLTNRVISRQWQCHLQLQPFS